MIYFFHFLCIFFFSPILYAVNETKYIIARFNEDLNWLHPISHETVIYNKGNSLASQNVLLDIHVLPNVGRESHSYLTYVIDNYDNLPEVLVFSQARIDDHVKGNPLEFLKQIAFEAKNYGFSQNYKIQTFPHSWQLRHYGTPLAFRLNLTFGRWMDLFLNGYKQNLKMFVNGIFAVRKDKILKKPKEAYIQLIKHLDYHSNPGEGHYFERTWEIIFNMF